MSDELKKTIRNGRIKSCCRDVNNLVELPKDRPDVTILVCNICLCRHITMLAETGIYNKDINKIWR